MSNMLTEVISLFNILGSKWRLSLLLIIFVSLFVAVLDAFSVIVFALSSTESKDNILQIGIPTEIIAIIFIGISAMTRGALQYLQIRFSYVSSVTLGKIIFDYYLNSVRSETSMVSDNQLISSITARLNSISGNIILSILQMVNFISFSFFLIIGLLLFNIYQVLWSLFILMSTFSLLYIVVRPLTKKLGIKINAANTKIVELLNETTQIWQMIRLRMQESAVSNRYSMLEKNYRKDMAVVGFLSVLPRFGIEVLLAVSMGLVILINESDNINLIDVIVFGYAALRTVPMAQQGYNSLTLMTSGRAALRETLGLISDLAKQSYNAENRHITLNKIKMIEIRNLALQRIHGSLIKPLNITINVGDKIAITGASGSGKSTLLDTLMGLISVGKGSILYNGNCINTVRLVSIYEQVAYLPQMAPLINGTVKENILQAVEDTYEPEFLHDLLILMEFTTNSGEVDQTFLNRQVGDRGRNLSGGQRQRIQLINTLISKKDILVLDEATSALDERLEQKIIDYIINQSNRTIILISHNVKIKTQFKKIIALSK